MNVIRANGPNDLFVADVYGHIFHFNGASWKEFTPDPSLVDNGYAALAVRGNLVIAVGENGGKCVITVGRRIH